MAEMSLSNISFLIKHKVTNNERCACVLVEPFIINLYSKCIYDDYKVEFISDNNKRYYLLIIYLGFKIMQGFLDCMKDLIIASVIDEETVVLFYKQFFNNLISQKSPEIKVLAGSPGSGKTTFRKKYFRKNVNYHIHDMDEVLISLPGYKNDLKPLGKLLAFDKWMMSARIIADRMASFAISRMYNIIYDRTCGAEESYLTLKSAKSKFNYKLNFYCFYLPVDQAVERVYQRSTIEPRIVNKHLINEYCARFSALWPYYLEFADNIVLFDTEKGVDKKRLIYSSNLKDKIVNIDKYNHFLDLGKSIDLTKNFPQLTNVDISN